MSTMIYYELLLLAASLAVGVSLMAVYDGLRLFRMLVPHGSFWTGIEDAAYWLTSSIATFLLLFYQNDGILRWYAIAGVLGGMLAYNATVSRIYRSLLKKAGKYITIKREMRRRKRAERKERRRIAKEAAGKRAQKEKEMGDEGRAGKRKNAKKEKRESE